LKQSKTPIYRQYEYNYKQPGVLYLQSTLLDYPNDTGAKIEFRKLAGLCSWMPTTGEDWSSKVQVGDESRCYRLKQREAWTLLFRKGHLLGHFTLAVSSPLKPTHLEQLGRRWLKRAMSSTIQVDKRPHQ